MANIKGNSTKGYSLTAEQATRKFSGKTFNIYGLPARDLIIDNGLAAYELKGSEGWELIQENFGKFLKGNPKLK